MSVSIYVVNSCQFMSIYIIPGNFPCSHHLFTNAGFFWNQYWQCVYLYWSANKNPQIGWFLARSQHIPHLTFAGSSEAQVGNPRAPSKLGLVQPLQAKTIAILGANSTWAQPKFWNVGCMSHYTCP